MLYVNGERYAIVLCHSGNVSIGIKIPLINRSGNRTKFKAIVTLPGYSVGYEANIIPNEPKHIADIKIPTTRRARLAISIFTIKNPIMIGIVEIEIL